MLRCFQENRLNPNTLLNLLNLKKLKDIPKNIKKKNLFSLHKTNIV